MPGDKWSILLLFFCFVLLENLFKRKGVAKFKIAKKIQCKSKDYAHGHANIFAFLIHYICTKHKNYIVCYWQICQKCISTLELIHTTCWARVRARMHIKTLAKFQFPKNLSSFSINDFEIVLFNETHKNQNVTKPSQSTFTIKKILLIKIRIMNEVHAFQFVKWQ